MATGCESLLTADILKNCDEQPVGGLEVNAVIINKADIDYSTSTLDVTNDLLISNIALVALKSGFAIEGIKQVNSTTFELVKNDAGFDKYKHTFKGVVLNPSVANKKRLDELASGSDYVLVVEKKWKGASDADAFDVYGWDSGLQISVITYDSNDSDGVIKFELSSPAGFEEPKMPRNVLETDYATTLTAFGNKFA